MAASILTTRSVSRVRCHWFIPVIAAMTITPASVSRPTNSRRGGVGELEAGGCCISLSISLFSPSTSWIQTEWLRDEKTHPPAVSLAGVGPSLFGVRNRGLARQAISLFLGVRDAEVLL